MTGCLEVSRQGKEYQRLPVSDAARGVGSTGRLERGWLR